MAVNVTTVFLVNQMDNSILYSVLMGIDDDVRYCLLFSSRMNKIRFTAQEVFFPSDGYPFSMSQDSSVICYDDNL